MIRASSLSSSRMGHLPPTCWLLSALSCLAITAATTWRSGWLIAPSSCIEAALSLALLWLAFGKAGAPAAVAKPEGRLGLPTGLPEGPLWRLARGLPVPAPVALLVLGLPRTTRAVRPSSCAAQQGRRQEGREWRGFPSPLLRLGPRPTHAARPPAHNSLTLGGALLDLLLHLVLGNLDHLVEALPSALHDVFQVPLALILGGHQAERHLHEWHGMAARAYCFGICTHRGQTIFSPCAFSSLLCPRSFCFPPALCPKPT